MEGRDGGKEEGLKGGKGWREGRKIEGIRVERVRLEE